MAENKERAERAYRTLIARYTGNPMEDSVVDLLTDLRHLAPQYGINFDQVVERSAMHFNAEITEG